MGTRPVAMPPSIWGLLGCCFLCDWALGGPRPLHSLPPLSSQVKPGSEPRWLPQEGAEAALAFLYSGDAQQLSGANCSEHYEAQGAGARLGLPPILWKAAVTLAQAANFLNMLLQANDIRESSVEEDMEWYQALIRSVAEGDLRAYRALLTFNPPPGASHLQLALQATRVGEETILQDLSKNRRRESPTGGSDTPALQKRVLTNDLGSLGSPKWPRGDGYVGDMQHVRLSPPFLECQEGRLRPGWLITLSTTFYGLTPDLSPEVRGQVQMDVDLQSVNVNQCASGPGWYANTHMCELNSTQCVPLEGWGFVLGRYLCRCRPGFYGASHSGGLEESATQPTGQFGSLQGSTERLLRCQPCPKGCTSCTNATPCLVEEALVLRALVLACQACCMLAVLLSMLLFYRYRRSKRIRASGVVLLETILLGSLLLYFPVFILYFKPSVFCCIALRWVRLLGFTIVYGTIVLKLYRVLQLFLSQMAQRVSHLSSRRLLQRLGLFLLLVLGFLLVWTAGVLEPGQHTPLVTQGQTPAGRRFHLCHHGHWDYVMVVAEMLLLCWGSFLCYAGRAVPAALHEPRHLGIALHNELLLSSAFHAARFVLVPSLHPDWTLLLFFFHTHITVTVTLALIFIPKFRKLGAPSREEMVDEAGEDELDLQLSGSYLNSSIASAWSEHSLDPGDIRDELKKLYAQLEAYKTKEMAANNPHLPKKRGGSRQGLGRSFMRYLAEFPEALAWQHSQDSPGRSSMPGSSRHRLLSSSFQEPQWKPALRKSRSTYEHDQGREQDLPLLNSLLRSKLAKKASRESRESVEEPPVLGFRSISAHNLTVGEKLLRAPPTSLQKSLSVVAGSREKALLVASQAFLEETYRQAKEQEERKTAEAAMASPVWRPSARRLEQAQGAPLSAPLSPAKSSSVDSPPPSGKLQEDTVKRSPHPPIMHQVPTPILALSGPCLGEPHTLSPTSTLAPALMAAPGPSLAPIPVSPQGPSVLTYICPWEDAELPVKKENVARKDPSGPEQGNHSLAPARAKLWRALSIAAEKRGGEENGMDVGDGHLQTDEDRPKIISKSHGLKTQQGSMRSLGLAIKALTHSRSTYREKESGKVVPGREKGRASGEGAGACPQSPRPGRPRAVSKQTALAPSDDESLQNQQNAHTSRMLQVCHQEGSREQDDRGRRTPQSLGEERAERAVRAGPAPLRQVRQNTVGDRTTERAKAAPIGGQELSKSGRQSLGSADSCVAEVCPWEAIELETCLPDSSNKAEICPWEVSEGTPESRALRRDLQDSQEERGKAPEKSEPKDVAAIARKKPERLVKRQEAVCPWENAGPGGLSPPDCDRTKGRSEAGRSMEAREVENAGLSQQKLKTFFCKEQKSDGDLEFLCPWERTDFRGPSAISTQVPRTTGDPGCLSTSVVEVCPWKAGDTRAVRKTEICPWELGDEVAGKEVLGDGTGGESLQGMGSSEEKVGQTGKTAQELSHWQESACPWEDTAPGHSSPCLDSASSRAGGLSQGGSRATQGCPQENLRPGVTPARAETCSWKVGERIREDWTAGWASGEDSQEGKEKMPGTLGIKDATTWEKQEAVCPWESVDPDSFSPPRAQNRERPKASFQASGLVGSKIAEICPWDVEGILPGEKAEICPWEAGTGAGEQRALGVEATSKMPDHVGKAPAAPGPSEVAVPAPKEPERPAQEQEVGCPWESMGPRGSSQHSDTGRPEVGFQELDRVGYRQAEVCPWEVEEVPASEKAQTCPWELSEVATGKGLEEGVGSDSAGQREKTLEKGQLTSLEDLSKWEKKQSLNQEAIGPWGKEPRAQVLKVADLPSPSNRGAEGCCLEVSDEASEGEDLRQDPQMNGGIPEHVTQEKAPSKAREFTAEDEKEKSIQFQAESMAPAGSLSSTEQGEAGSQRLVSVEGRTAEACAVEAPALDVPAPDSGDRAETLCLEDTERLPGRGLSTHHGKGDSPEKGKALEKPEPKVVAVQEMPERAGRKQEAGCLQESQDCGGLSPQAAPQACDRSRGSSEAADGMRTSGAQVCPWEAEEAPFTKKAEICPWEVSKEAEETGELEQEVDRDSQEQGRRFPQKAGSGGAEGHFSKEVAQVSREQETVCLREGTDYGEEDSPDTDQPKVSLCAARSMVSKMAELCQWEITNPEGNKIKGTMADICPWEGTGASSEESDLLLLTGTQTEIFSPTAPEKPPCLLVHRPPGSFLLESKSPHPEVSKSANTSLEGVKGLQGPSALGTGTSLATDSSLQEAEAQKSSSLTEEQEVVSKVPCEEVPHQQSILGSGSDSSIK